MAQVTTGVAVAVVVFVLLDIEELKAQTESDDNVTDVVTVVVALVPLVSGNLHHSWSMSASNNSTESIRLS